MVNQGKSNEQIYTYIAQNYGSNQIAVPQANWILRISIGLPFMLIGSILVVAMGFAWKWSRDSLDETDQEEPEQLDKEDDEKRAKIDKLASKDGPLDP